ncbi:tyrosine-type recombinase/integrase [Sulfurimonas sp.]
MARKTPLTKVKGSTHLYKNISKGITNYYVKFTFNNKQFGEKNITKIFGITTLLEAKQKTLELYEQILKGCNPFETSEVTLDSLFESYISKRSVSYQSTHRPTYNKWVKPIIGGKDITKVTKVDITIILDNMKSAKLNGATIRKIKTILNPVFSDAVSDELIAMNTLDKIRWMEDYKVSKGQKLDLAMRVNEKNTVVAKKIYQAVMALDETSSNHKFAFLVSLMCGRRRGEILKITYGDIDAKGFVTAWADNTKTSVVETYPLPDEAWNLVIRDGHAPTETLTRFKDRAFNTAYDKLIENANIAIKDGSKITSHDNRTLLLSILVSKGHNFENADRMLSHRRKDISGTYFSNDTQAQKKLYEEYWEILRSPIKYVGDELVEATPEQMKQPDSDPYDVQQVYE